MKKLLLPAAVAACFVLSSAPSFAQWVNLTGGGINYPAASDGTVRKVGISQPFPEGWLSFPNPEENRKIVFSSVANNPHEFNGLGTTINDITDEESFRFQIAGSNKSFRFFRAINGSSSLELFTIRGGGNVGVGTDNPLVKLQVQGGNVAQVSSGSLGDPASKWSALGQPPSAFPTGGAYFGLFNNWSQQNFITGLLDNGVKKDGLIAWQDQTSQSSFEGTRLRIGFIKGFGTSTSNPGNPAVFSEKATILANGNLGVGTNTPGYRIELPNITTVGSTAGKGRAVAWEVWSSGRWKENIKTLEKASDKIKALRGVEYDLKKENGGGHAIGFIAEEAGKVLPESVTWEADGKNAMGMNYDAVIPVLVEAFKELSREKDAQIKALENRLAQLESAGSGARLGSDAAGSLKTSALLRQNRPNPFQEKTVIEYVLPEATSQATLFIYNLQGEQLKRFDIADKRSKSIELNGNTLPAGLYLYSLLVDGKVVDTKQMVLTK
jgi:hypothetical protein